MHSYKNPAYNPMREDLGPSRLRAESLISHVGNYKIYKRNQSYDVVEDGVLMSIKKSKGEAEEYCVILSKNFKIYM
ncbi:hypothetical protein ACM615_01595 [Rahnella sp. PAMC25617]|uniref:hypothetical protein n=1 Tax=Rahnella sp. PAMC25617 TaxID=3399684 RepID=UPI003D36B3C7